MALRLGLGLGLMPQGVSAPSGGGGVIAAPFDTVNGPTDGPTSGPYESWSVTSASPIANDTAFTVLRQGYDASGGATTYLDTFLVTRQVRQPYPNQASLEADTWALSDYIYSTDTPSGSAANNATFTSPKPICNWVTPHRSVVGNQIGGTVELVEITAWHRNARQRREVASVVFSITDGTNTVTCTPVSATIVSGRTGDQVPVLVYRMPLTDITSLNAGVLTVRARVYPWIGAAAAVADSNDGTAVSGRDFGPRYFYKNTGLAAAPYYAYVKSGGSSGGVFSTTPATAEATPFDTVLNMFNALNSGAAGKADGVIVRLGDDGGTPWVLAGAASARNQDCAPIIITRDPAVAKANARCSFGTFRPRLGSGGTLDAPLTTGCLRFVDVQINRITTGTFTGEAANQLELQFDNCDFDNGANNAAWLSNTHDYHYGTTFTNMNVGSGPSAATYEHRIYRGISWTSTSSSTLEAFLVVGSQVNGVVTMGWGARSQNGSIIAFNAFKSLNLPSSIFVGAAGSADVSQWAFAQNLVEYITGGATVSAALRIGADSATGNTTHILVHNNTFIGAFEAGRWNALYDEGPTARTHKLQSFVGNIAGAIYTKSDIFRGASEGGGDASTRLGNWAFMYGVGCRSNFSQYQSADPLGGSQAPAYGGPGSLIGTDQITPQMATSNFTSYAGTTVAAGPTYTAGAGGGTYSLTSGAAPVAGLLDEPVLSHDFAGTARPTTNDTAGAYLAP